MCLCECTCLGVEVTKQISMFGWFLQCLWLIKTLLPAKYHMHIWHASTYLCYGDTCQIRGWLKRSYGTKTEMPLTEINRLRLSDSHLLTGVGGKQQKTTGSFEMLMDQLTHCGRDKMAAIFQTTFSNAFSWMKMYKFRLKFHWSLFPRVQLTTFQYWFR